MIRIDGTNFKDELGRILILRGINLGGSSKVPYKPDGATFRSEGFYDHRHVSFVGRPFPLLEADEHYRRLREWGFSLIRLLVPWEAIEHLGPHIYDQEYLDYIYGVVKKAGEYDLQVLIDPHQDAWSRFTGGDGAPGWLFEELGFDITHFDEMGAAVNHQVNGDPYPRMLWPSNYDKFAAATMFTLFFGGKRFAPNTNVGGESVQEFLQQHYFSSIKQVAIRLRDFTNVIGYNTMNEPSSGYIGIEDIRKHHVSMVPIGKVPSPYQSMLLASGFPQKVDILDIGLHGSRKTGSWLLNKDGKSLWKEGHQDIWKENGVWDLDRNGKPVLLKPDYFYRVGTELVDFNQDHLKPFLNRFSQEIRLVDPQVIIFLEGLPGKNHLTLDPNDLKDVVNASHWYDGMTVYTKHYRSWAGFNFENHQLVFGAKNVKRSFEHQIKNILKHSSTLMKGVPTLIGETGIPFDLDRKESFKTGDYLNQIKALDRTLQAMEANLASFVLWNYTPDNTNERGDKWNDEDFSIFCRQQQTDPDDLFSGSRAGQAFIRPYARSIAGKPIRMSFNINTRVFEFEFEHDPAITVPSEFFIPNFQYKRGYWVEVSDGTYEIVKTQQVLHYRYSPKYPIHSIRVFPKE